MLTPAQESLVVEHRSFVEHLARQLLQRLPGHVELDDLVADGNVGLVQAARSWRASPTQSFNSWAWPRIVGEMKDGLRRRSPLTRGQMKQGVRDDTMSLNVVDDRGEEFIEMLAADPHEDLSEFVRLLKQLPDRERVILARRHLARDPLAEIARDLGVSESRISQMAARALQRLAAAAA